MPLKHADVWRAIDRLAAQHTLSASGLAKKAGLSPTVFNPSKRASSSRKRWPSTESIAKILQVTGASLEEFIALVTETPASRTSLPLISFEKAGHETHFDELGHPRGPGWEEIRFPALSDPHAFALEINGKGLEPVYREGDRLIIVPTEKPRRGDRVVVGTLKREVMVKELGRESAQKVELISLRPADPPMSLPMREIAWIYRILWAGQ